jgi:putative endonuclease
MEKSWFVYIIETECGALYTGITTDVERRYAEHLAVKKGGNLGAKYFRGRSPRRLVYTETCEGRSAASKRECEIKAMSRKQKLALVSSPKV